MPELPEVERGRLVAEMVGLGQTVKIARSPDDRIVFCDQTPATVCRRLKGRTVTAACRHGKQLWLESLVYNRGCGACLTDRILHMADLQF